MTDERVQDIIVTERLTDMAPELLAAMRATQPDLSVEPCSRCHQAVVVAVTSQTERKRLLAAGHVVLVVCLPCLTAKDYAGMAGGVRLAPGAPREIRRSQDALKFNLHRRRN